MDVMFSDVKFGIRYAPFDTLFLLKLYSADFKPSNLTVQFTSLKFQCKNTKKNERKKQNRKPSFAFVQRGENTNTRNEEKKQTKAN